jgi:hypothetical protein
MKNNKRSNERIDKCNANVICISVVVFCGSLGVNDNGDCCSENVD